LPEVTPQSSAWQSAPWLSADLIGNDFSGASDFAHIFNSLGNDMNQCLPTDASAFTPTTASREQEQGFDSPAPSTPSMGSYSGAKEQTPVKLNLSEAIDRSNGLESNRSPFALETPPPPQRWAFRADAPCFVPKEVSVLPGQQPKFTEAATPDKVVFADTTFLEWRKKMLLFRPNDVAEYQNGEDNLRAVPTSSINNIMVATPPVEIESENDKTDASFHGSGKGSGHGYIKRGGKAESRGQIRALAADARAHLASPAVEISRKDAKPDRR
jgi:hypothetical protein